MVRRGYYMKALIRQYEFFVAIIVMCLFLGVIGVNYGSPNPDLPYGT